MFNDMEPHAASLRQLFFLYCINLLIVWQFLIDIKFQQVAPKVQGACGRLVIMEHGGRLLSSYLDEPFADRAEFALQLLSMVYVFWVRIYFRFFAVSFCSFFMNATDTFYQLDYWFIRFCCLSFINLLSLLLLLLFVVLQSSETMLCGLGSGCGLCRASTRCQFQSCPNPLSCNQGAFDQLTLCNNGCRDCCCY